MSIEKRASTYIKSVGNIHFDTLLLFGAAVLVGVLKASNKAKNQPPSEVITEDIEAEDVTYNPLYRNKI